jgi:hypothetical protein
MLGYLPSAGLPCIALILLSLTSGEAVQRIQKKSVEPFLDQVTGRQSVVNCGEYAKSTNPSKEALLKSLACAEDSANQHKPSRLVVHMQGVDSLVAYGVLSDATGQVFYFQYDSAPCGGPGCAEEFEKRACRVSDVEVVVLQAGFYRLGLKKGMRMR